MLWLPGMVTSSIPVDSPFSIRMLTALFLILLATPSSFEIYIFSFNIAAFDFGYNGNACSKPGLYQKWSAVCIVEYFINVVHSFV